jgi:hypothetical protein
MFRHLPNDNGGLVCVHRDLSVCPTCAGLPDVVEVHGEYYRMTPAERRSFAILNAALNESAAR